VLGFAIAVDYSNALRFKARVKAAADVASIAACEAIAKNPRGEAGLAVDELARRVAAAIFAVNAPSGAAGAPTVAVGGSASAVTTLVRYEGVAPSNFGDALGYGGLSVSVSTTSPFLIGDASRLKIGS
jgi:Flp pilus assembly protein TadG